VIVIALMAVLAGVAGPTAIAQWAAIKKELLLKVLLLAVGVKRFARALPAHWGIENSCHWSLDVTYREDDSRIRDERMRENFAWLNRFTLSLLKQHPSRASLIMKRRCRGWNDEFLTQVPTGETT
jgi:predicted transposase YbfD/YdcC